MKREEVRRAVIVALAADDELGESLVLKGGNALGLVHHIGERASLDIDYSIEGDFEDIDAIKSRIERALDAEFSRRKLRVFDVKMGVRPELRGKADLRPRWGGWTVEFKLITLENWKRYAHQPEKRSMVAMSLDDGDKKAFQIDISKFEFVESAELVDFDGFELRVYSPAMIVYEKLRALCQQLPEYEPVTHPRPRPRDFVDIVSVLAEREDEVLAKSELLGLVFSAKDVPVEWLRRISESGQREFHRSAWVQVEQQLPPGAGEYETYYERVISFIGRLEASGIVEPPA